MKTQTTSYHIAPSNATLAIDPLSGTMQMQHIRIPLDKVTDNYNIFPATSMCTDYISTYNIHNYKINPHICSMSCKQSYKRNHWNNRNLSNIAHIPPYIYCKNDFRPPCKKSHAYRNYHSYSLHNQ